MIQVSVVVPTYNRGSLLRSTLDSVRAQTLVPELVEIIVVDDGSTDDTVAQARTALEGAPNVRIIEQANGGVARARNRGWRAARGEWIAFLDHDDTFHPTKLERLLALARPKSGVLVPRWCEVASGNERSESPTYSNVKNAFAWLLDWTNPIVSMSVPLVRRAALERVGGFDPRCVPADDWDLWLRLTTVTEFAFCDEVLVDYFLHAGQQRRQGARMFRAVRRALGKHPFGLAQRPLLLWWLLWSGAFVASTPAYEAAKAGAPLGAALRAATRRHPLALLSPQWVALWARKMMLRR